MSALGDIIVDALQEFLRVIFSPIETVIENHADVLIRTVVGTPHPNAVFERPTNGAWPNIYDYYWETMVPLALFLWALSIGLVIFFESTSHLFSSYHRSKLKKRAFSGLLGILSWWWIVALSLRFIEALTGFLVPTLSDVSFFQTLSFSTMGVLGVVVALATNFVLFVLVAIIYFMRHVTLYLFVLLMPLLIVFWIPGVGPFSLVSRFMKRLAGFYVPFLFMTVPVALLFRLGDLLGTSFSVSMGGIGAWLTALVIPIIAVASPFVLFWQAGALFFMADRASRHVSARRARTRIARTRSAGRTGREGGRNFVRGARGRPAIRVDGQTVLNSGGSRAHAAGSRLTATGARLRARFGRTTEGDASDGTVARESDADSAPGRAADFENLQNRTRSSESATRSNRDGTRVDDPPRYIQ